MVMSLLESLYKSLYKNVKDPALSIFRSPWRPEKSCVFAATVLDPSDTQRQTRTGRPFSSLYRTRPAAFCPYPGGLNFGQIGSASPTNHPTCEKNLGQIHRNRETKRMIDLSVP